MNQCSYTIDLYRTVIYNKASTLMPNDHSECQNDNDILYQFMQEVNHITNCATFPSIKDINSKPNKSTVNEGMVKFSKGLKITFPQFNIKSIHISIHQRKKYLGKINQLVFASIFLMYIHGSQQCIHIMKCSIVPNISMIIV